MSQLNRKDIYVRRRMATKNIKLNTKEIIKIINVLQNGKVELSGQAIRGSNSTFLCNVSLGDQFFQAIYKPTKGERPLWDFPHFTLAQREVAAFIVSQLLGWNFVPPTVLRDESVIFGKGSLQFFIEHDPMYHYLNFPSVDPLTMKKIVLFDLLINNADRKSGHVIFDQNSEVWLIDHGLCFNVEKKHRTVIWEYAGEEIPEDLKYDIRNFISILKLNKLRLVKKLKLLISNNELFTIIQRGEEILSLDEFPSPEPNRRSYPWPPI